MLGDLPRLNRVFDAMGVVYLERKVKEDQEEAEARTSRVQERKCGRRRVTRGGKTRKNVRKVCRKVSAREAEEIRVCHLVAMIPSQLSAKCRRVETESSDLGDTHSSVSGFRRKRENGSFFVF